MDRQETKRRLEERRERLKMEEKQKKELKKKQNKNRNSSGSSPTKYPHETKDNSRASEKDDVKRYETKRGDDDSGIFILKTFFFNKGGTAILHAIRLVN